MRTSKGPSNAPTGANESPAPGFQSPSPFKRALPDVSEVKEVIQQTAQKHPKEFEDLQAEIKNTKENPEIESSPTKEAQR